MLDGFHAALVAPVVAAVFGVGVISFGLRRRVVPASETKVADAESGDAEVESVPIAADERQLDSLAHSGGIAVA